MIRLSVLYFLLNSVAVIRLKYCRYDVKHTLSIYHNLKSQISNIMKLEAQQYFTRLQYGVPLKMHTTQHLNPTPTSTREINFLAGKVSIHLYTVK